ncbi:MAG: phosphoenolpyruvate--protein phosphotransferase [Bacteroidetes bacterium]|nr:phosphoenolpyruvate--protein phosphotransferase [Bacteroidota bacterium]
MSLPENVINGAPPSREVRLRGCGVAPGISIGPAYVYARASITVEEQSIRPEDVASELERFEGALVRSERDLKKVVAVANERLGDESVAVFEAQILMLKDEAVLDEIRTMISSRMMKSDYAVRFVLTKHRQRLEASGNEYLQERSSDIRDVEERIITHLRRNKLLSAIDPHTIVVAENLTAADVILFSRRGILGCVMDYGGSTSHVSIMARALGLPTLVGAHSATQSVRTGDTLIVDGLSGALIINPTRETTERYGRLQSRYTQILEEQKEYVPLPAETIDGRRIALRANLEFKSELELLDEYGAEGIGLFRTEMLFLTEGRLGVSEEDQYKIYSRFVEASGDHGTTIRVLDLGGDKLLPVAHREHNPFLGWRGIRVLLDKQDILRTHLRAILRASVYGKLRILLPMVTTLEEVKRFRVVYNSVCDELRAEGIAFDEAIRIGAMIEIPSAALTADQIAAEVDFLSVGTNDLTQYVLAVDRGNDLVAELYQELHPAVLRLLRMTVDAAHAHGKTVSVCGEMAADSRNVPILVGLGVDELSASPVYLPQLTRIIRSIEYTDVSDLADRALNSSDAEAVRCLLDDWLKSHPYDLLHILDS